MSPKAQFAARRGAPATRALGLREVEEGCRWCSSENSFTQKNRDRKIVPGSGHSNGLVVRVQCGIRLESAHSPWDNADVLGVRSGKIFGGHAKGSEAFGVFLDVVGMVRRA